MKNTTYIKMIAISFILVIAITFAICLAELTGAAFYALVAADVIAAAVFVGATAVLSR
ncbi:Uncharacterised protein [uncultured Eubacterium sp.]|nr:Uncharacterised protein [uncultured Eubacterium sp.]